MIPQEQRLKAVDRDMKRGGKKEGAKERRDRNTQLGTENNILIKKLIEEGEERGRVSLLVEQGRLGDGQLHQTIYERQNK